MSFTLHGSGISTCTSRVLVVAAQAGVSDKVKLDAVAEFTDIYKPEWTAHQPFNQMPYLVDNVTSFELYESRAVGKYLALKVGSDLVPKQTDVEAYARFEQACSIEMANFDPAASGLAHELVFSKLYGQEPNQERVKEYKDTLAKRLAGYERVLSKHKYVAGDKLTVADLYHLPYGKMVDDLGVAPQLTDTAGHPNLARWWKEISSLPAWAAVQATLKANAK